MGIFDKNTKKRKGDEFDSPVEQIDLSAPSGGYGRSSSDDDDDDRRAVAASPASPRASSGAPPSPTPAASERPAPRRASGGYGIDDAIALMRTLPSENVELVVQVVKHTLESTKIEIGTIIEDATDKQARIDGRVKVLRGEITSFEQEIATRRKEIESLEADHRETTMVKDRLQLAERLTKGESTAPPARANRPSAELPRAKSTTQPPSLPPSSATISSGSGTSITGGYVASAPPAAAITAPANGPTSPPTSSGSDSGAHRMPTHTVVKK